MGEVHGTREEMSDNRSKGGGGGGGWGGAGRAPLPFSPIFLCSVWPNALTRRSRAPLGLKELEITATYKYYCYVSR